jgi:chorismate mutase
LADLRNQIDKIDDLVIQKMAERMKIVEKIGNYKKDNNITILQVNRWDEILQKRTGYAKALKLSAEFTEKLLELMHSESIRKQTEIMNEGQESAPAEKLTHA